jgi:hypothetical protein
VGSALILRYIQFVAFGFKFGGLTSIKSHHFHLKLWTTKPVKVIVTAQPSIIGVYRAGSVVSCMLGGKTCQS